MPDDGEKASVKRGYFWDPEKLAWIEAEAPLREGEGEVSKKAEAQDESVELAPVEEVQAEAPAPAWVLEYKGTLIRAGGAIIDLIILFVVGLIIGLIAGQFINALPFWATLLYGCPYFVGFWSWRGQTPGMMLIGARVMRRDGSPVSLGWSLLRYIFYLMPLFGPIPLFATLVSGWFVFLLPIMTLVVMALTREKRGIHDFVAGTIVINTRGTLIEPLSPRGAESDEPVEDNPDTRDQS